MYASAWRSFEAWAQARGALAMPASPPLIAAYLAHLAEERRLSVATVQLHQAALAAVHKAHGHDRSHRQRGRPADYEGHRAGPRQAPEAGQATDRRGPGRSEGHGKEPAAPWAARGTDRSRRSGPPGGPKWTWPCWPPCGDGLLRRSEAAALTWGDVEFRDDGAALVTLRRSKTDQEAEGTVLYVGREAAQALQAIRPAPELLNQGASVFGMTTRHIGNRVRAAAKAAGLGEGFTGHSGRVGMAQDLVKSGVELPALMTAGRWKSSKMPARYTERQAADRGAVARYYQEQGG